MQIKLFTVPIGDTGASLFDLNRFLRTNKILEVREELIGNGSIACWCYSVRYLEQTVTPPPEQRTKIDYKQILDEATFRKFSGLREIRKKVAADEGLPAFAIFTDGELAELAKLETITEKNMLSIKGIGEKKVERFAKHFIDPDRHHATPG